MNNIEKILGSAITATAELGEWNASGPKAAVLLGAIGAQLAQCGLELLNAAQKLSSPEA